MTIRRTALVIAVCALLHPASSSAQDALTQAKTLYASADYEQALNVLEGAGDARDTHYYRALCLIALGRADAANKQIAAVVGLDPLFVPAPGEVSPRVTATFTEARRQLLPQIARKTFTEARRLFQAGDREKALEQFELTMRMLDDSMLGEGDELADLKLVASGFIDLARSEASPPAPVAAAAPPVSNAGAPPVADTPVASLGANTVTTLPITVEQTLPPWYPAGLSSRRTFSGAVRVEIDETGRVTSARMEKSVHAAYDTLVLAAARRWVYQPATLNGVPIPSEKTVEIELRPPGAP